MNICYSKAVETSTSAGSGRSSAPNPAWLAEVQRLLEDASRLLESGAGTTETAAPHARLQAALERLALARWTVLVSGLCSVGKSSFVGALWGNSDLLPTAVRDCTQTNTVLREPLADEAEGSLRISHLTRDAALDFAFRDLSYYRIAGLLDEVLGPLGPRQDEGTPEERLRASLAALKKLFNARPDLFVLYEYLTDDLEKLEEFLAFLDSPRFHPGQTVEEPWADRRAHLMGTRRPDGRSAGVGALLAYRRVELVAATRCWRKDAPGSAPSGRCAPWIVDTPWIPAFHNARRAELILGQARAADVLVILALPVLFTPEPWMLRIWEERPELKARTVVVFNQVDTVDIQTLFAREGFYGAFEENAKRLRALGLREENLCMACARLPFLEQGPRSPYVDERIEALKRVLQRIASQAGSRQESFYKRTLLAACGTPDGGLEILRARLLELGRGGSLLERAREGLEALHALHGPGGIRIPDERREAWAGIASRARAVEERVLAAR